MLNSWVASSWYHPPRKQGKAEREGSGEGGRGGRVAREGREKLSGTRQIVTMNPKKTEKKRERERERWPPHHMRGVINCWT